ncbi:hypothetical protein [Nocardia sp. NBC_01388]|uniref:hypothetical protein n=1 Tax=Nocardia sp. NBC_01388 TaxID=2903596 RepID=UPI003247ECB3
MPNEKTTSNPRKPPTRSGSKALVRARSGERGGRVLLAGGAALVVALLVVVIVAVIQARNTQQHNVVALNLNNAPAAAITFHAHDEIALIYGSSQQEGAIPAHYDFPSGE